MTTNEADLKHTINIPPTWVQVMPGYLRVLADGTDGGKRMAREALMELARKVDQMNEQAKEANDAKD